MEAPGGRGANGSGGKVCPSPEEGRARTLNPANTGLGRGLGEERPCLLIVFGTYCVILEEIKGTRQPLVEI